MNSIKKIGYVFDKRQKIRIFFLIIMIVIGAIFELFGLTAILPFINVAMDSEKIFENEILSFFYDMLGMGSANTFLALLAVFLIIVYFFKNLYLILMNNSIFRFSYGNQRKLSRRLLECYLKESYTFYLYNNSADLVRNVEEDTNALFDSVVATMQLASESIVCVILLGYLMITDPSITLGVGLCLIVFIVVVMGAIRRNVRERGSNVRSARGGIGKWLLQTFGGIKETKIMERENFFLKKVDEQIGIFVDNQCWYQLLSYAPKPAMETACIGSVMLVIAVKLLLGADSEDFVSTMAVFAVAAFRLLPAFNRITGYVSRIMFNRASVDAVYNDLKKVEKLEEQQRMRLEKKGDKLVFNREISVRNLTFRYPNTEQNVLTQVNLTIPRNKSVAFIGPSGAGKTTLVDNILGILDPLEGNVTVDGVSVMDKLSAWHEKIGYIPQTIYLLDDTIKRNIAFAVPDEEIDGNRLKRAIEEAQLTEFVASLEDGLETEVGERGVRLSGGQRQRIGIARALYTNPEVLVLDEATSALDNETEKAVMDAIDGLSGKKTLIIIAHRLSTIKNCDIIYEVNNEQVTLKEQK